MKKIAVTGGLSSGKTTVCHFFKELGAYVVSADKIVHQLLSPHTKVGQQVIDLLGNDIVVDGNIDRSKVANKVFNNRAQLTSLEKLLHPAVLNTIDDIYHQVSDKQRFPLFIAEVPLLFEVGCQDDFDVVIYVWSDRQHCQERFEALSGDGKSGYDKNEYEKRMARQLPPEEKAKRADILINNTKDLKSLREAVMSTFNQLISLNGKR